jgi:hypothetical protein
MIAKIGTMALFVRQDEEQTEIQRQVSANLEERLRKRTDTSDAVPDDGMTNDRSNAIIGVVFFALLLLFFVAIMIYIAMR